MIPSCGYWCIENTNGFDQRISIDGTPIACSGLDDDSCYPYGGICQQLTNVPECGGDRQSNDFTQGGFNRGCKNEISVNYNPSSDRIVQLQGAQIYIESAASSTVFENDYRADTTGSVQYRVLIVQELRCQ